MGGSCVYRYQQNRARCSDRPGARTDDLISSHLRRDSARHRLSVRQLHCCRKAVDYSYSRCTGVNNSCLWFPSRRSTFPLALLPRPNLGLVSAVRSTRLSEPPRSGRLRPGLEERAAGGVFIRGSSFAKPSALRTYISWRVNLGVRLSKTPKPLCPRPFSRDRLGNRRTLNPATV